MKSNMKNSIYENIKVIIWAVALAMIIKTSVAETMNVPTGSMEDTLLVGDFFVCNKIIYGSKLPLVDWRLPAIRSPKPGDVVVFKFPGDRKTNYVKRCVAVGGQIVELKDKVLYVDGKPVENPEHSKFVSNKIEPQPLSGQNSRDNWGPYRVPDKHYFMMGDNRDNSYDSRFWGPVSKDLIVGKPIFIHFSWDENPDSPQIDHAKPLSVPESFLYITIHFFEQVRWNRMFSPVN